MISLVKSIDFKTFTKLPKNVGGFKKLPNVQ